MRLAYAGIFEKMAPVLKHVGRNFFEIFFSLYGYWDLIVVKGGGVEEVDVVYWCRNFFPLWKDAYCSMLFGSTYRNQKAQGWAS